MSGRKFWRVHCHIGHHPGQWQFWFREQCCALGWPPPSDENPEGFTLEGGRWEKGWADARSAFSAMRPGDGIVATLPNHRVGRLGSIYCLEVEDKQWKPIVGKSKEHLNGENGRRILVRWNLSVGPSDPGKVVTLPEYARLPLWLRQGTVKELPEEAFESIELAMLDEANWTGLNGGFNHEKALSSYLAANPHRIEDGLIAHPAVKNEELTFDDGTRADVVLQDRRGRAVIVECKQGAAESSHVDQVQRYGNHWAKRYPEEAYPRLVVVHGGSRRVRADVSDYAKLKGVSLVHHELRVDFNTSA